MAISRAEEFEAGVYPPAAVDRPSVYAPTPCLNGPRHEYLVRCVPDVNQRILSSAVDLAMRRCAPCHRRCHPPLLALQEAAPNIYAPLVDKTRASEVFGRRTLPKLRRDLDSADADKVVQALQSISDIVHDPEKIFEAVRVRLAEKLVQLMQHEDPRIRERSCAVAGTLAGRAAGREAVLRERAALPALKGLLLDGVTAVRFRAALTLRVLAISRLWPRDFDEADLAPFLLRLLTWEEVHEVMALLLHSLQLLLEMDSTKEMCINQGAFTPLLALMHNAVFPQVASAAAECLARLAECALGEKTGDQLRILSDPYLRLMLLSANSHLSRSAARLAMTLTHTVHGKQAALNGALLEPLLALANRRADRGAQLCALQALTNMAEHPATRSRLLQQEQELEALEVTDGDVERVRRRLLAVVRWQP